MQGPIQEFVQHSLGPKNPPKTIDVTAPSPEYASVEFWVLRNADDTNLFLKIFLVAVYSYFQTSSAKLTVMISYITAI